MQSYMIGKATWIRHALLRPDRNTLWLLAVDRMTSRMRPDIHLPPLGERLRPAARPQQLLSSRCQWPQDRPALRARATASALGQRTWPPTHVACARDPRMPCHRDSSSGSSRCAPAGRPWPPAACPWRACAACGSSRRRPQPHRLWRGPCGGPLRLPPCSRPVCRTWAAAVWPWGRPRQPTRYLGAAPCAALFKSSLSTWPRPTHRWGRQS